ncbi:MAG: nitroreductase [Aquisalinus sp.]|nr:nitroreductase [Aquisalinus sp.]
MTSVSEAVRSRKSVRAFLDKPVPDAVLREVLEIASRAPSGGNLQPWFVHVVSGVALTELKEQVQKVMATSPLGEGTEYDIYPQEMKEPYRSRQRKVAGDMYALLGIERGDKFGRMAQMARNFSFFDAPVGIFFAIDRDMAQNQWAHLGMFMQTLALVAVEKGLATCMQEAWAIYYKTVGEFLKLPPEQMLYCGMALGFEDRQAVVNDLTTERAELREFVNFHG